MVGICFENRHYEDESIKRLETKHCRNFDALVPRLLTVDNGRRGQDLVSVAGSGIEHRLSGLYDRAPGPRACPLLEHRPSPGCIVQSRGEALLGFLVIASKQQRQQEQIMHVLAEDPAEITGGRIFELIGRFEGSCFQHLFLRHDSGFPEIVSNTSRNLLWLLRASRLRTCLVRTPPQVNLAPSFIKSKSVSSPSGLIVVTSDRSIASRRPLRSWLASRQTRSSSAVQGVISFPSTRSVRLPGVSVIEILNIAPAGKLPMQDSDHISRLDNQRVSP